MEDRFNIDFGSDKEYVAKFLLTPDIKDFEHFDKNIKTTNLRSKFREPEQVRAILTALHILTNKKYMNKVERDVLIEEKSVEASRIVCEWCNHHNIFKTEKLGESGKCQKCLEPVKLESAEQIIVKIPIYEKKFVFESRYPKIFNSLHSSFRSMIETSSARDGHLIKAVNTRKIEREDTIEDRTTVRSQGIIGGLMGGKKRVTHHTGGY